MSVATLTVEQFDEITLRLSYVADLLELTSSHTQSLNGPLPSAVAIIREQVKRASTLLMEGRFG